MVQTPEVAAVTIAAQTTPPEAEPADGGIFNPTTLLLIVVAFGLYLWFMRRRGLEQRLRERQRETARAEAEQSARDVAHVMRRASAEASCRRRD